MQDARAKKDYKRATEIARQLQNHRNGKRRAQIAEQQQGEEEEEEPDEGEEEKEGSRPERDDARDLDVNNLAPHAEAIADEILGWVENLGFKLPKDSALGDIKDLARTKITSEIKKLARDHQGGC